MLTARDAIASLPPLSCNTSLRLMMFLHPEPVVLTPELKIAIDRMDMGHASMRTGKDKLYQDWQKSLNSIKVFWYS